MNINLSNYFTLFKYLSNQNKEIFKGIQNKEIFKGIIKCLIKSIPFCTSSLT